MATQREKIGNCLKFIVGQDQCSDAYKVACYALAAVMTPTHRDALGQLIKSGPIWDGDVISKAARDDLIEWGLAGRVVFKGSQGYTAANYYGWDVHRANA